MISLFVNLFLFSFLQTDEPEWVEVVTDLLLSLLAQKSHLVRSVVKTVFTLLSGNLTSQALELILDVSRQISTQVLTTYCKIVQ